uniref:Uncharacterized protein n=1 Tax=Anguilla anguilla TaxID=7936 RepID=A0A0E9XMP0_ANGAN
MLTLVLNPWSLCTLVLLSTLIPSYNCTYKDPLIVFNSMQVSNERRFILSLWHIMSESDIKRNIPY